MKNYLLKFSTLVFAALIFSCNSPKSGDAQYIGTVAQQTVTKQFTQLMTATRTHVSLQNLGQASHSLQVTNSTSLCSVTLDGSQNGSNWIVLATTFSFSQIVFVNGYYPLLRVTLNFEADAGCNNNSVTVSYSGYQTPLPPSLIINSDPSLAQNNITVPTSFIAHSAPWILYGGTCYNTGTAPAFLELFDSATPPTLGSGAQIYEIGIPGTSTISLNLGAALVGSFQLYVGAATTATGNTAVTDPIVCSAQQTINGAIAPAYISSP